MIKCPVCGSQQVYGFVKLQVVVNVNTGELEDGPIERYDDRLFDECNCNVCNHYWMPEN